MKAIAFTIDSQNIRQLDGLYSLNDLHKASGNQPKHQPNRFLRNEQIQALVQEIKCCPDLGITPVRVIRGNRADGLQQGTYVCRELVYAYAMWISAKFHLLVIRAFDAMFAKPRTSKAQREKLHEAIALLMTKSKHLHFKDCYKIIHQRFNVNHLDEIPEHMLPEAVNFVHQLLTGGGAEQNSTLRHDMKLLALGTLSLIDDFGDLIKAAVLIDEKAGEFFRQSATKASRLAIDTSHKHDLRTIRGEPIVSRMLTVTNDLGVRWSVNGMLRKDP